MPTTARANEDQGRRESFFRESAERAYEPQRLERRFDGYIPRLGPRIENPDTGERGERGILLGRGGVSGCIYAQIPIDLMKHYMDLGWDQCRGSSGDPLPTYTIAGPRGEVDCILLVAGEVIPGVSSESNIRDSLVQSSIMERTGLKNEFIILKPGEEPEPAPPVIEPEPEPKTKKSNRIGGPPARKAT